ncbi:MAG: helix-turn-helix domain-containing protein, partial [Patescibacteria group bacterium]|nr:helix-turn-helix domain-containing protein [Patescibacteria group bacterium]
MNEFRPNKILSASEVVAEELIKRRQEKNLNLKDVAKKLNIKHEYLEALENGEYAKLPAGVYGKNFLREYAVYLGLDSRKLLKELEADRSFGGAARGKEIFSQQVVKKHNFLVVPKIVRSFVIIIVVLALFVYLGFCLKKIISPPMLLIIEPLDNSVTNNNFVVVFGKTEPEAQVEINGEPVALNPGENESFFTERINLKLGLNTITITAQKKYGRGITI